MTCPHDHLSLVWGFQVDKGTNEYVLTVTIRCKTCDRLYDTLIQKGVCEVTR